MKNAVIAAIVAALVASGGTYAATRIDGHSIKKHSMPLNRLVGHLPRGPIGPAGPTGSPGPQGPQGPAGVGLSVSVVQSADISIAANSSGDVRASCPAGARAISGGALTNGEATLTDSFPSSANGLEDWTTGVQNMSGNAVTVNAYAVCAS